MSVLLGEFKNAAKREASRFRDVTSSEYWCAVVFTTRAQKDAFLKAMDWVKHGGDKYLNGLAIAKDMGIELPEANLNFQGEKVDRQVASLPVIPDSDD